MTEEQNYINFDDSLQTKCQACGGLVEYSPSEESLKCIFCGNSTELDLKPVEVIENDFDYWKDKSDEDMQNSAPEVPEIRCKQCGAVTTLSPNTSSAKCSFCDTPLILDEAVIKRFWKPEYILPFRIAKNKCSNIFKDWLGRRWFMPNAVKKMGIIPDKFNGLYIPFWTYDAASNTEYLGQRGDNYEEEYSDEKGETHTRTYTDWTSVSGSVSVDFDDVTVPATDTLPEHILNNLTEWDSENLLNFRKEFLAGFVTEIYKTDFKEGLEKAKKKMESEILSEIRKDIGGDKQTISSYNIDYFNIKFKHLLLPLWISAFKYKDKLYQFVINGRSGKVTGKYPLSATKITATVLLLLAVILVLWKFLG